MRILVAALVLASCSYAPLPVVEPVRPVPAPVVEPTNAVPYATTQKVVQGMTYEALVALMGSEPDHSVDRSGGERDAAWAAVGRSGESRVIVVRINSDGLVVSRVLF